MRGRREHDRLDGLQARQLGVDERERVDEHEAAVVASDGMRGARVAADPVVGHTPGEDAGNDLLELLRDRLGLAHDPHGNPLRCGIATTLTARLRADPPALHGEGSEFWGLEWNALEWLERTVRPGMATLETGAGSSTIVFAAGGAEHEAVSPSAAEHEAIRAECARLGISSERLRFHIGLSHEVLAEREPRPLDLALIDGAHGFPYPVLDWWYLAGQIELGGLVVLDDAYMPPVGMLVDLPPRVAAREVLPAIGDRNVPGRSGRRAAAVRLRGRAAGRGRSFDDLLPGSPAVASARHRFFSSRAGLATVRVLRRRAGFLFR